MDQVFVIRHKVLVEGQSQRRVAREMGVSRLTVRRYVEGAEPGVREPVERPSPIKEAVLPAAEAILEDSVKWTTRKQRLTARRLLGMLRERDLTVGYTVVKEIAAEWRRKRREVSIPLTYRPGDLAEVDFFEVVADVDGQRQKAWMFVMRLMHSGRDFAWLYPRQDQVCFLDGHVRAFEHFGAVPQRSIYDNLKAAVARALVGSERELQPRFLALCTHYVLEACFARPRRGDDKGGVEGRGKGIRWQELVPIPAGPDLATISRALQARLDARMDDAEVAVPTIGARFVEDRAAMTELPPRPFVAERVEHTSVSRRSLARLDSAVYSVPVAWAQLDVTAYVGVDEVRLVGPRNEAVVHPRKRAGERSICYLHYLPELRRKPQAVRQVADDLLRELGAPYDRAWRLLVDAHGPRQAARIFAAVLGAIVDHGDPWVRARVVAALDRNQPLLIALAPTTPETPVIATESLPAQLAAIEVGVAAAADYDHLLRGAA